MGYRKHLQRGIAPGILAAALLLLAGARLGAQDFERTFGRENNETGRAVVQTSDGGYIAAGYTIDAANHQMAYVVRMKSSGFTLWERRFSVGGNETSGMDIKQLANGDHILIGTISTSGNVSAHIYAIRFTDNGDLLWYKSYGTSNGESQYGTSVVETSIANPSPDDIGNLVVSGYTTDNTGERKGVLMRLWSNGDIRWVQEYDTDPTKVNDNELMSVDESRVGAGAGDIVATGFSSVTGSGDDVWVLRVDGITGRVTAGLQGSATFSTTFEDRGYSIQELRQGSGAGDLVIAGESWGRSGSSNSEILMLETRPAPCDPLGQWADQFQGDGGNVVNVARCVREITSSKIGRPGDVIVTGTSHTKMFGNSDDMFMQKFTQRTMVPAGPHEVYGGTLADSGYGVAITVNPPGYIAAGVTSSVPVVPPGHRTDLYVVRTTPTLLSCTALPAPVTSERARLRMKCIGATLTPPQWSILCSGDSYGPEWGGIICQ
jgi:hypothetical protein